MVVFKDNPEKYNTPEMFLKLQDDITLVMELHKQIAKKEEDITLNPAVSQILYRDPFWIVHRLITH